MSITISTITLPAGLIWVDEFDWSPTVRTLHRHPGGWYIEATAAGNPRPITLEGGQQWCWITRTDLLALQSLLETTGPHLLTLHDSRKFDVQAIGSPGVVDARPVPMVAGSGAVDPDSAAKYYIQRIALVGVAHT